jgi:hypothetical protein
MHIASELPAAATQPLTLEHDLVLCCNWQLFITHYCLSKQGDLQTDRDTTIPYKWGSH